MKKRVCESVCLVLLVALSAGLTGCRAGVETSGNDEKAASNRNTLVPDLSAASERVRSYIEKSRAEVLAELKPTEDQLARARRLHKSAIVCDLMGGVRHCQLWDSNSRKMEQWANDELAKAPPEARPERLSQIRKELGRWRPFEIVADPQLRADKRILWDASGITLSIQSVSATWKQVAGFNIARMAALETYVLDSDPGFVEKVVTLDKVAEIKKQGKHAVLWHWHEAVPSLEDLDVLYGLGLRMSQISHGRDNQWGCGDTTQNDTGLTDKGRQLIRRMNELGMIVDGSHASWRSVLDMVEVSRDPIVLTHVGFLSVSTGKHAGRQTTDEGARAVVEKGGLLGICWSPGAMGGYEVKDFLAHIDYAVKLVGVDHVAVASDQSGLAFAGEPEEWLRWTPRKERIIKTRGYKFWRVLGEPNNLAVSNWPFVVTLALLQQGYSDEDIRKMLGQNFLRVAGPILARRPEGWLFHELK